MKLKDVANLAGVSLSTVSKVLNHKDETISEETKQRVLEAARRYRYLPRNTLSASSSWSIGVLFKSSMSIDSTLDGIVEALQELGYSTIIYNSFGDASLEEQNLQALINLNVSGIIWEPIDTQSLELKRLLPEDDHIKLITMGEFGGSEKFLIPYAQTSYFMTKKLISYEHTKIACLALKTRRTTEFLKGYRQCLFDHGIEYHDRSIYYDIDDTLINAIGSGMITGIICSHYQIAQKLAMHLNSLHYHAPEDVSIITIRNDAGSSWMYFADDELSTCTIRNSSFGQMISRQLIAEIEHHDSTEDTTQEVVLDNENTISYPPHIMGDKIVVIGSINVDTRFFVSHLPSVNSTTMTGKSNTYPGGKGVNQAIGVAKLGHRVSLMGNVGADSGASFIYSELDKWGVDSTGVFRKTRTETGKATIFVDHQGNTMISILSGANSSLKAEDILSRSRVFENAKYCLVQTEIALDTVKAACNAAWERGIAVVLKPSGISHLPADICSHITYLIPNEDELKTLCPTSTTLAEQIRTVQSWGVKRVIVTRGDKGVSTLAEDGTLMTIPAKKEFHPTDTTGAGDAFISAFVSYLMYGYPEDKALRIANYAAGYSTITAGAAVSFIDKETLDVSLAAL